MEINELIPDNKIVLVDADKYRAQKLMAELNAEQIDNEVQKRFLDYVKDSGVGLTFSIDGVHEIVRHQTVFRELNYGERGFCISLPQELKYAIASEALRYLNEQVEDHAKECKALVEREWKSHSQYWKQEVKLWKNAALASIAMGIIAGLLIILIMSIWNQ